MQLTCPKCHGTMRQYERSGVHVDQCTECRGIFLDRGELEKLVDAETSWHREAGPPAAPPPSAPPPPAASYPPPRYEESYSQSGHGHGHGYGHRKKRKSFFEELFD
jgi:uncharacterized protein